MLHLWMKNARCCCRVDGASAASVTSSVSGEATVAEAFLRMFVETCGHCDAYINTQQDGEKIFQVHVVTTFDALQVH